MDVQFACQKYAYIYFAFHYLNQCALCLNILSILLYVEMLYVFKKYCFNDDWFLSGFYCHCLCLWTMQQLKCARTVISSRIYCLHYITYLTFLVLVDLFVWNNCSMGFKIVCGWTQVSAVCFIVPSLFCLLCKISLYCKGLFKVALSSDMYQTPLCSLVNFQLVSVFSTLGCS